MRIRWTSLLIAPAIAMTPAAAEGAIIRVTYSGVVATGADMSGVFGTAGRILAGLNYRAVYLFDTSRGSRTTIAPYLDSVIGGVSQQSVSPSLGARLKIGDRAFAFNGANLGLQSNYPLGGAISSSVSDVAPPDGFNASFIGNSLATTGIPVSMESAFSAIGTPAVGGFTNSFQIASGAGLVNYAIGTLAPSSVRSEVLNSVPEPAQWALMVGGFGLIGGALRRRLRGRSPRHSCLAGQISIASSACWKARG